MPSEYPRSPRLLKGALVAFESQFIGPVPNIIVLQYNPTQLSRTLANRTPPDPSKKLGDAKAETFTVEGPPVETINLTAVLDATDQLEEPMTHPLSALKGIYPALSALELLLYPPSSQLFENKTLSMMGSAKIKSQKTPLVLFVWGISRVLPVRLTGFSVTEEQFDQALNPIKAKIELGMKALSYMELKETSIGYGTYVATQAQKEVMARLNIVNNVEQILGMLPI